MSDFGDAVVKSVTDEWLDFFQASKEAVVLRTPFWKLCQVVGPPDGVDADDERVKAAMEEIGKANAGCGEPG